MKRRTFIKNTSLAGAAGTLTGLAASAAAAPASAAASNPGRVLRLKGDYYRHYPVDFSLGAEGARGFKGWGESVEVAVPAEETALVLMHVWNVGIDPELAWKAEGPAGGVMLMAEWAARTVPMIKNNIPPILAAARKAGVPVIHVASSEHYAKKYPGFRATLDIAGAEPPAMKRAPRDGEPKPPDDRKNALIFGERFPGSDEYYESRIDFPEQARPLDSEPVVVTTHQFNSVLRHLGVWQLVYCGFAINWCLWFSPSGMSDMSRLGYRCSCIREGVTAVENKASTHGEFNKEQALWRTSIMFGYIHSSKDFIDSCGRLEQKKG
jgi:nicotinamidase-related amidase